MSVREIVEATGIVLALYVVAAVVVLSLVIGGAIIIAWLLP